MDATHVTRMLDDPSAAAPWLTGLGVENSERGQRNLVAIADAGVPLDLLVTLCAQLEANLPSLSDPDRALNNLERFIGGARSPLSLASLFERDPEALRTVLPIFSASQHLSDLLVRDSEAFDLLRMTEGQPIAREVLIDEICNEVAALQDEEAIMRALRRYKNRETLRIAYGDIVRLQPLATVTKQISFLADAICEAAVRSAWRFLAAKRGAPRRRDGTSAGFVVLALGKLGGCELNYSSDIDLIFLCDGEGMTDGQRSTSNPEFFKQLAKMIVRYLGEVTDEGTAYRVDMRLRPHGNQGPLVVSTASAARYYDVSGRTWERQAYVKARPIAGDAELGTQFLRELEPWVFRRYLNRADITGIKALKRRIEQRSIREGDDQTNVKTGRGGIRDIEFVIQFLQLLNGGDLPSIRTGNTLQAILELEQAGCLTPQERAILETNYQFLRKVEHRLQIMFDLQTHTLPDDPKEMRRLAIRMGYPPAPKGMALEAFQKTLHEVTEVNRKILNHLLHDAFADDAHAAPETELVLDPAPDDRQIEEVLGKYAFRDIPQAYRNLMALSQEPIPFLSTRRCRHFLASIAPHLLEAIADTPDPDFTLVNLTNVSDSLGGKGVLWELFSFSPPTLHLYVRLCATSPYLTTLLTSNPGMIDELMDSLVLDKLPQRAALTTTLNDLIRGAEDIQPILHSFKHSQHLRVGVRDILGKEDIRETHRALSDIAEACLEAVADGEHQRLMTRYGEPVLDDASGEPRRCEMVVLALGKLGGREPNYHSDLDIIYLYEGSGNTRVDPRHGRATSTTNQHFFSQLGQKIMRVFSHMSPYGQLYEVDARLRPTGKSGPLAVSLQELARYFREGAGQLWERQALCKARPVYGSQPAQAKAAELVREIICETPWQPSDAEEIFAMRHRMQESASPRNMKRGPGGTVDIEFTVQMLQLKYAREAADILQPGTLDALEQLTSRGLLDADDSREMRAGYRLLRSIESRLRLMNTTARHDLPESREELTKLAYLLGYAGPDDLQQQCLACMAANRERFQRIFAHHMQPGT